MPGNVRIRLQKHLVAAAVLLAAVLVRWLLDPFLGNSAPLVTMFGATAAVVWIAGARAGAFAAVVGYLLCDFLFIEPRGQLVPTRTADLVAMLAYLLTSALIVGIGQAMRRARSGASERAELLRVTLGSIGDAVVTTDPRGHVNYMNVVAETLTGWTQAQAMGEPLSAVFRIVNEQTRQPVESPAVRALREGVVVGLANHTVLMRRDGGECPIDDSAAPIRDENGQVSGCVLIFRDVTEQRRALVAKASELAAARLLAAIVESSDDAIVSKSLDGIIQSWNAAAERLFGHSAAEAVGRHISLVIPAERMGEEDHIIANLKAGRRVDHFETERMHRDGRLIQVSLTISPIRDDTGKVIGASKIVRDVTRQRQAETERQKFVTLVESSTDFIGIGDLEGRPSFINRAGLQLVGLSSVEEARQHPLQAFFFPEDQERITKQFLPSVLEKGHGEIEIRFRHFKTGEARWMVYKVLALPDASGRPMGSATVSQDITERKRMEDDLRRLASDLSEADRRKDEFLATLAHELRNPLAVVSNAAGALRRAGNDPKAIGSSTEMLERQVRQMSRLVDDLLDVSRVTRGKIELRKQVTELGPVIEQALEGARAQYGELKQCITLDLPSHPVHLLADPVRLAQIVGNLLNNACKFTGPGGNIAVTVRQHDGQVSLRVRDNGIGIGPEHIAHVFEMFSQADTSPERSREGLGIGLTLVKTLVEMHGGSVEARSEGLGRGSEFEVRLPASAPAQAPAPEVPSEAAGRGRRILIVDDNQDGAESLAMLLQFGGHETHVAHDGPEGLALAERVRPEVVLLDIGLPGMNGYDVCRRIREQAWGNQVALIALSGWGQEDDRRRSREAGFDKHLVKPVDHEVLAKVLDKLPVRGGAEAGGPVVVPGPPVTDR